MVRCDRRSLIAVVNRLMPQAQRTRMRDPSRDAEEPHQENLGGPAAEAAAIAEHDEVCRLSVAQFENRAWRAADL